MIIFATHTVRLGSYHFRLLWIHFFSGKNPEMNMRSRVIFFSPGSSKYARNKMKTLYTHDYFITWLFLLWLGHLMDVRWWLGRGGKFTQSPEKVLCSMSSKMNELNWMNWIYCGWVNGTYSDWKEGGSKLTRTPDKRKIWKIIFYRNKI